MTDTLTESTHAGEYIISEASGQRSRDAIILTGGSFPAGTVLGKVTANSKYTKHDPAGADGTENAIAILFAPVDASTADVEATISARDSEVNGGEAPPGGHISWIAGISAGDKSDGIGSLAGVGIIVRGA